MILDGEDDFVNMLRHVLGVLGMTSEVVRHEDYAAGLPRRLRPRDRRARARATRATTPTRRWRRLRAAVAALLAAGAAVPRGVPGAPGAVPPARHPACPTRTSSSRAPSRRSRSTGGPSGSASTTRSSGGPAPRRCPRGVRVEADPETGDIHHLVGSALPRHPVPRRVDPHRARLRPAARPGLRCCCCDRGWHGRPTWWWSTTTTPTRGTSCTWSPRSPACCRPSCSTTRCRPEDVLRHSHVVLSPGPGHPGRPGRLRGRPRGAARRAPGRCSASASACRGW